MGDGFIQPQDPDTVNVVGGAIVPAPSVGESGGAPSPPSELRSAGVAPIERRSRRFQSIERLARDFESMERGY